MICDECIYAHRCGEEAQATAAQRGDCVSATSRDQAEASQLGGVRIDSSSVHLIRHTHPPQTPHEWKVWLVDGEPVKHPSSEEEGY